MEISQSIERYLKSQECIAEALERITCSLKMPADLNTKDEIQREDEQEKKDLPGTDEPFVKPETKPDSQDETPNQTKAKIQEERTWIKTKLDLMGVRYNIRAGLPALRKKLGEAESTHVVAGIKKIVDSSTQDAPSQVFTPVSTSTPQIEDPSNDSLCVPGDVLVEIPTIQELQSVLIACRDDKGGAYVRRIITEVGKVPDGTLKKLDPVNHQAVYDAAINASKEGV